MIYLTSLLLSVFITVSLIPVMTRLAARYQMVDLPDARKVHIIPVPRIGGLAMAAGAFIPIILWTGADDFVRAWLVGAGVLVLFGLVDDIKGLGHEVKFAGQVLAALVAVFYGGIRIDSLGTLLPGAVQLPGWFSAALSIIAIVGVTNAINLSDGLDGLAGGISLLCFCCIGYLAWLAGSNAAIIPSLSLAGAIFGFLRFNSYPASLFMGDTGSQLLGFSAVVFAIKISQGETPLSAVLPLIILGFPVLDTLTVMVERIREGRSPFSPDKKHFHHRLIRLGLSHSEAVFTIYVIQAMLIVSAILFRYNSDWVLLISYAVFSAIIVSAFASADRTGFQFKHYPLFDYLVKDKLKKIRNEKWAIRLSFTTLKIIVPLLLLLSCLLPARVPVYFSISAVCMGLLITAVRIFAKNHTGFCLRFVLYFTIPLVLYLIEEGRANWIDEGIFTFYQISFGIIALFALLTVRYTRRKKGFRTTPMDFLIIFIAVVVPNLPDQSIRSYHLGFLAMEIVVLFFSYEVLITEQRGKFDALTVSTLMALALISIRGAAGF